MPGQAATGGQSRRRPSWWTVLMSGPRSPSPSAMEDAIPLPLNRRGLVREAFADPVLLLLQVPIYVGGVLLMVGAAIAGDLWGWPMAGVFVGLLWLGSAWSVWTWLRRIPLVVIDANGIDLQATGAVPWNEIRAVVIDHRRLWLELNRDTAAFVAARTFPSWFTTAHLNLLGDAACIAPGPIHVALRWVDATPQEIAAQIRRFTTVPVRMALAASANAS
jgi:hypothetical protein